MFRSRLLFLTVTLACSAMVRAEPVTIAGGNPREHLTVTVRDAPIAAVLLRFSATYNFEVTKPEAMEPGEVISATMTGSLEEILRRLLRNMNHMIVRSPDNPGGIEKVILFGSATSPTLSLQEAAPQETSPRDAHRHYSARQGRD